MSEGKLTEATTGKSPVVRPEEIAAAWGAWHSRHGGKIGPGPAFAEAIRAAFEARAAARGAGGGDHG